MLLELVGSSLHPPSAGWTEPNFGPADSKDKVSYVAMVNHRGPGEPLVTNLNRSVISGSAPRKIQDLLQVHLPGDGQGEFSGAVLNMEIHPGVTEEEPGHGQLLLLEAEQQGGVPGLVPGVPVHAGLLSKQLHTSHWVPARAPDIKGCHQERRPSILILKVPVQSQVSHQLPEAATAEIHLSRVDFDVSLQIIFFS